MATADAPTSRLAAAEAEIEAIRKISGIAGISVGVVHHGNTIYTHHFGTRDSSTQYPPDNDTLYGLGSCSKMFFAMVTAACVKEGKLDWNIPVKSYVPEMRTQSETVNTCANLVDLIAHRTGITGPFHLTFQGDGDHRPKQDFWTYLAKLRPAASFRGQWMYNSHGYSILGEILEKITERTLDDCLQHYVCHPLGLSRTTTSLDFEKTTNFAKPHAALSDGTPHQLASRQDFRGHFFEPAAGVYSTLNDMLAFTTSMVKAADSTGKPHAESSIPETDQLFSRHIPLMNPSLRERSYAMGWIRTQLPGVTGLMGDNLRILPLEDMPVIGQGMASRLAMYHQGATVGYFPSVYIFPETQSSVVVLTNSIALGDAADWVAQALIQSLFDDQQRVDWVALSHKTAAETLAKYDSMIKENTKRHEKAPSLPLTAYCGTYWDCAHIFSIVVETSLFTETALTIAFQGDKRHQFELRHLDDDTFEWTLTRDETAKRARYHMFDPIYFRMRFVRGAEENDDRFCGLEWRHDPNFKEPEVFNVDL